MRTRVSVADRRGEPGVAKVPIEKRRGNALRAPEIAGHVQSRGTPVR
jgi:hypothetical protein